MRPDAYRRFTESLRERLAADPRVLGLVALGSMAEQGTAPDAWSDHDFFVITRPGDQESFRSDLSWLPDADALAFHYGETAHGVKALYADGHLLEFAVFDPEEMRVARVNRYRVLLDRERIEERLAELAAESARGSGTARSADRYLLGQFLTALLVGVGRDARGERLAGQHLVRGAALPPLLALLAKHVRPGREAALDDLDSLRRFETAYPSLGAEIHRALEERPARTASLLLRLAERELEGRLFEGAGEAIAVVRRRVEYAGQRGIAEEPPPGS